MFLPKTQQADSSVGRDGIAISGRCLRLRQSKRRQHLGHWSRRASCPRNWGSPCPAADRHARSGPAQEEQSAPSGCVTSSSGVDISGRQTGLTDRPRRSSGIPEGEQLGFRQCR